MWRVNVDGGGDSDACLPDYSLVVIDVRHQNRSQSNNRRYRPLHAIPCWVDGCKVATERTSLTTATDPQPIIKYVRGKPLLAAAFSKNEAATPLPAGESALPPDKRRHHKAWAAARRPAGFMPLGLHRHAGNVGSVSLPGLARVVDPLAAVR